jgi:hypothetical protein
LILRTFLETRAIFTSLILLPFPMNSGTSRPGATASRDRSPFSSAQRKGPRSTVLLLGELASISIVENRENSPAWMAKVFSLWNEWVAGNFLG